MEINKEVLIKEINLIKNSTIKEFTKLTLLNSPDYFFIAQASSTGKYHPICTIKVGSLIVHVQRVVYLANRLCDGYGIKGIDRDIVLSAEKGIITAQTQLKSILNKEFKPKEND